jgi:hypothetical protein
MSASPLARSTLSKYSSSSSFFPLHLDRRPSGHPRNLARSDTGAIVKLPRKQRQIVALGKRLEIGKYVNDPSLSHGQSLFQTLMDS